MKKILMSVLFLCLGMTFSFSSIAAQNEKETAYDRVIRTGVLRCGYLLYPPLLTKDINTGAISGISHDILEEIGKRLSIKIEWAEEVGTDVILQGMPSRYDMTCFPLYASSGRARVTFFSTPLFFSATYLVTKDNDTRFDKNPILLNDAQYTIATLDGEITSILAAQRFPMAVQHAIPQSQGYSFVLKDVAIGKADATISDKVSVDLYNKENEDHLKIIEPPFLINEISFPIPQDIRFKSMLDITLNEMQSDGWIENLLKTKYPDYWEQIIPAAKRFE